MRTLIVFSSKYGAGEKCANLIGKDLKGEVHTVNLKKEKCEGLHGYDTIIIGGSIYASRMGEEVKKFVENNKEILCTKNIGLFVCCKEIGDKAREYIKLNLPKWIIDMAFIQEHVGHEISLEKVNFLERFLIKGILKIKESYSDINYDGINNIIEKTNGMDVVNG